MDIEHRFFNNVPPYLSTQEQRSNAWQELYTHYRADNRHYHNLHHLETLFRWADEYAKHLEEPEIVSWAIWYHDIIYHAKRRDNEEQSALLARQRLLDFGMAADSVIKVVEYIRATAQHLSVEATGDLAYFLDFDLAILGSERTEYATYAAAVRREYAHVPGFLYRRGRKKVLRYFLAAERLYRTEELYGLLEERARENLNWELRN